MSKHKGSLLRHIFNRKSWAELQFSQRDYDYMFKSGVLSKLLYGVEFWWSLTSKKGRKRIISLVKRAKKYSIVNGSFDLNEVVFQRQFLCFCRLRKLDCFIGSFPKIANSGRRFIAPKVRNERERKFCFLYMTFCCIQRGLLVRL